MTCVHNLSACLDVCEVHMVSANTRQDATFPLSIYGRTHSDLHVLLQALLVSLAHTALQTTLCTAPFRRGFQSVAAAAGMLCTLSWARERGFENADIPLHVYGPPGLADYIRSGTLPVPVLHTPPPQLMCRVQHNHLGRGWWMLLIA